VRVPSTPRTPAALPGEHPQAGSRRSRRSRPLWQVAERVRKRIADHIATQTGLITTEVNVTVVDVRPVPHR